MKVLMITEKDAANASLSRIANKFVQKGHIVKVFATFCNESVLADFDSAIVITNLKDLEQGDIDWCDIIFCSTLVSVYIPPIVFFAKKPIFTHNYLMNKQINWGGDICFAPTRETVASDYEKYMHYSYIGIGEPKYDDEYVEEEGKRFLFIDSGHYPFSIQGKRELARILIRICKKFTDYELVIKPRFLPGDKVITHRNNIHLYDVIKEECKGDVPTNMVMLDHHEDLKHLINISCTVISLYSTAFVGAVVAGKGLILIDNLPTTDVYDIRHKTFMRNRENMLMSGALIDYTKVDELLPCGVKTSKEYLDYLLEEKENVSDKICETCEYLFDNFYSKNRFPKQKDSTYKNYKNDYVLNKDITWEKVITQRCEDYILLKSLILIDFHINSKLDISYVLNSASDFLNDSGFIDKDKFIHFFDDPNNIRDNCIILNHDILLQDDIDSGVLLNSYYLLRYYDRIISFSKRNISAFCLFRAFTAYEFEHRKDIAREYLVKYFNTSVNRQYNVEISDMPNNKIKAYIMLIDILKEEKNVELISKYCRLFKDYYVSNYLLESFDDAITSLAQRRHHNYICETELWLQNYKR